MGAITDPEFSKWLLDIGKGRHVADVCNRKTQYLIEIPNHYISENLITDVFEESFTLNDTFSISQLSTCNFVSKK